MANPFIIPVRLDAKGVTSGLRNISSKFKTFGRNLTMAVSLPLAGIATAASRMALGFDESLTKVNTLVGISKEEIAGMREEIMKLGGATAQTPSQLADALFTVTSAGLRGKEAMDVLEMSAKSAASGLGETKSVAQALTGIMQSYKKSGMTAARATDVLTATVRAGNLEASELAPVLGRVTGIASQLGISFEEVGASIATFTRLGVNSAEAVTGLSGIMNTLIKPTDKTHDALATISMDMDELRRSITERGLAATLVDLVSKVGDNQDVMGELIPNVRALSAVLGTAGAQGKEYVQVAEEIANSTGLANKVFKDTAESSSFKFKQSLNQLAVVGTEIGTMLLPPLIKAATFVSDLVKSFMNLDGSTKSLSLAFAAVALAIGPLLTAFGFILSPIGLIITAVSALGYIVYKNFDAIIGFVAQVINYFKTLYNSSLLLKSPIEALGLAWETVVNFIKVSIKSVLNVFRGFGNVLKAIWERDFGSIGDIISNTFSDIKEDFKFAGEESAKAYDDAFAETLSENLEMSTKEGLKTSLSNSVDSLKEFFINKGKQISDFIGFGVSQGSTTTTTPTTTETGSNDDLKADIDKKVEIMEEGKKKFQMSADTMKALAADLSASMGEGIAAGIAGMAEAIGSGANLMKSFLGMLGGFMVQIGQMLISFGIAQFAFLETLKTMNPFLVIAAGAALVLAGTVVKSAMSKGPKREGATAFAQGGIVTGPTLGLVGEAGPEAIIPLDRLSSVMGGQKGEFTLRGQDLVLAMERAKSFQSRITG